MELGQETLSIVAVAAAGVAGLSLLWNIVLARRVRRLRAPRRRAARREVPAGPDVLVDEVEQLAKAVEAIRVEQSYAIQRVGFVRFDAFEDMGGKLSFALAFLDGEGSGMVLSSINGRSDTRIYAKPIEAGASRQNLSDEETEAIRRALAGGAG